MKALRPLLTPLDTFLNTLSMYRVVLYGLTLLAGYALILSIFGWLPNTPLELLATFTATGIGGFLGKITFSKLFKSTTNAESSAITSLILFFIVAPSLQRRDVLGAGLAAFAAMGLKYLLAFRRAHIFNPVAVSAVLAGLAGIWVNWWVGSAWLTPAVAVLGFVILRKTRRFELFATFLTTALLTISWFQGPRNSELLFFWGEVLTAWPLIFFGTVMLTEPLTMPHTRTRQLLYAALVGILTGTPFAIPPLHSTPELALILANGLFFLAYPRWQGWLTLKHTSHLGSDLYHLVFHRPKTLWWRAGQYMEWTLQHPEMDPRGNRRYFTIASAPNENEIAIGLRLPPNASSFKQALLRLKPSDSIWAAQVAGDFTLSNTPKTPITPENPVVLIAGGIGITPMRAIIFDLIAQPDRIATVPKGSAAPLTLLYACRRAEDFAYHHEFLEASKKLPLQYLAMITRTANAPRNWSGKTGHIDQKTIQQHVTNWQAAEYFISGPTSMVKSCVETLRQLEVPSAQIHQDYFPGY